MLGTRYEEYSQMQNGLPFFLNADIKRNRFVFSKETNWHENLEIQFCREGSGNVFLDGKKYQFYPGDIAVVNSNVIHYTGSDEELVYDALIIGTDFCYQMGFDINSIRFEAILKDPKIRRCFSELKKLYFDLKAPQRTARLNMLLLEILLGLSEHIVTQNTSSTDRNSAYERVKKALLYIRDNFMQKITLEEMSRAVFCNKYTLCKDFKKYTGQTVFESLNKFRCIKAKELLKAGESVSRTASLCGFDNLSFFAKTFKRYTGKLPSEYKKSVKRG